MDQGVSTTEQTFHVDLRGVVDLLSHHLYSSPRVYLRELIQNSVDAITARDQLGEPGPRAIRITPADASPDGLLRIEDWGIGLDETGIRRVLATIGASTKRDDLGFARESFLGQFGIGLLSCFLVADEIHVETRLVGTEETWHWVGRSDGTYAVQPASAPREETGTTVALRPRRDGDPLLGEAVVRELIEDVAGYLPVGITVVGSEGPARVGGQVFPWDDRSLGGTARRADAVALCESTLGFSPLDVVDLGDVEGGVEGFGFVLPTGSATRGAHRLYSKHMLVSAANDEILPDWAFFVRAVLNTERLSLTASREALHEDELLDETRQRLGEQLKRWLLRIAGSDPVRAQEFFAVHHLGVKAMAARDDDMLDIVARLLAFETTRGTMTLSEVSESERVISYVTSLADYQQVAPLARALDMTIVNAGYAYDTAILTRFATVHPEVETRLVAPSDLVTDLAEPDPETQKLFAGLVDTTRSVLARTQLVPVIREFEPSTLHALVLADRDARRERDRQVVAEAADDVWAAALEALASPDDAPRFVLNARNPSLRRLAASADPEVQRLVIEAVYAQSLLSGRHPLTPFDSALVARALPSLIDRAIDLR